MCTALILGWFPRGFFFFFWGGGITIRLIGGGGRGVDIVTQSEQFFFKVNMVNRWILSDLDLISWKQNWNQWIVSLITS